ncbi:MAG: Calcineurin-like phosphoesterase superfamily domain protein [Methanocella sp. PtaU1.Bin125]|nr:MAG: Calcineurin-like phosphoesterase superfamily domain protein [Methanocella sp. PtaU1.Bin125]
MKLLCFSDIHGNSDAVRALIADTGARDASYDAAILAGDVTNLVVDKDLDEAQRQYDAIMKLLSDEYGRVYYVPGNRDRMGRGKNARTIEHRYGILLEPDQSYRIGDGIKITSSLELADDRTILVRHSNVVYAGRFDRTAMICRKALLHITGHTHTGVLTKNYLNTGFLYRDGSNGAGPMTGGYFDVEIRGVAVSVDFHALGPVKRAPLKCKGFEGYVYAPRGHAFPVKLGLK